MDYPTLPIGFHWAPLGGSWYVPFHVDIFHRSGVATIGNAYAKAQLPGESGKAAVLMLVGQHVCGSHSHGLIVVIFLPWI